MNVIPVSPAAPDCDGLTLSPEAARLLRRALLLVEADDEMLAMPWADKDGSGEPLVEPVYNTMRRLARLLRDD